jgi:quinol monooxygenase YgiN
LPGDIYWHCSFSIAPGQFKDFKATVNSLVEESRQESGCLAYEFSVNSNQSKICILERYRDSESVLIHLTHTFPKFADAFGTGTELLSFDVYGEPNDEVRRHLEGLKPAYMTRFDGFIK